MRKMKTVTDFIFLGSKIMWDSNCSQEIKRCFLLGRKAMTNLYSILKSRDIILLTKVHIVKAMIFPVVMYECESWTIKKAEHQSIGTFELWCWRRLLRVSWTEKRSNQSILKEISPIFIGRTNAESAILCPSDVRANSLKKAPMLGKIEGRRRRRLPRVRWWNGIIDSMDMSLSKSRR